MTETILPTTGLVLSMKMTYIPFKIDSDTEGVSFRFRDLDYTHQQTLMLKSAGQTPPELHRNPLYALQGVPSGTIVECQFTPYQKREQESRDNQRDRVKDVLGLRLSRVVAPSENGKSS
ncbi:MAG: hypothetical protein ACR2N0_18130 [Rubrobacteraceae bacterium]